MSEWWIDADNPRIIGVGTGPTEYVAYFFDADDAKTAVDMHNLQEEEHEEETACS